MEPLYTEEQARKFLKERNLKDGDSLMAALREQFAPLVQAVLEAEISEELGYSKYDYKNKKTPNSRNGHTRKTVKTSVGEVELRIPRDTAGEYEPLLVKKHERTLEPSLEDKILSLYARGMSTRDIHAQMHDLYGIQVSPEMVSRITDKILPVAREWQNRQLDPLYPILYLDGMVFNVAQDGVTAKKTAYLVYGVNISGIKDVLGIWIGEAESSKFWMSVLNDLKNRGVQDVLIASVDGLKGFQEAIESVFPHAEVQQCIIHQIRNSTRFVNYRDRKRFCEDMKLIYTAPNEKSGLTALDTFEKKWGSKYGYAVKSWRNNWARLATFFKYPEEIRRIIYTTNVMENLNRKMRKITKNKGVFPTDDSLFKMLYLGTMDVSQRWTLQVKNWGYILNQFLIYYGERIERYIVK